MLLEAIGAITVTRNALQGVRILHAKKVWSAMSITLCQHRISVPYQVCKYLLYSCDMRFLSAQGLVCLVSTAVQLPVTTFSYDIPISRWVNLWKWPQTSLRRNTAVNRRQSQRYTPGTNACGGSFTECNCLHCCMLQMHWLDSRRQWGYAFYIWAHWRWMLV